MLREWKNHASWSASAAWMCGDGDDRVDDGKKVKHIGAAAADDDDSDISCEDGSKLITTTSMMMVITKLMQQLSIDFPQIFRLMLWKQFAVAVDLMQIAPLKLLSQCGDAVVCASCGIFNRRSWAHVVQGSANLSEGDRGRNWNPLGKLCRACCRRRKLMHPGTDPWQGWRPWPCLIFFWTQG